MTYLTSKKDLFFVLDHDPSGDFNPKLMRPIPVTQLASDLRHSVFEDGTRFHRNKTKYVVEKNKLVIVGGKRDGLTANI
jgi:hypothetical protein